MIKVGVGLLQRASQPELSSATKCEVGDRVGAAAADGLEAGRSGAGGDEVRVGGRVGKGSAGGNKDLLAAGNFYVLWEEC